MGDARSLSCTDVDGTNTSLLDSQALTFCVFSKEQKKWRRNYKLLTRPLYLTCIASEQICRGQLRSPTGSSNPMASLVLHYVVGMYTIYIAPGEFY